MRSWRSLVRFPRITVTRAHDLTKEIEQNLRDKFGQATHIALHVEPIK